MSTLESSTSTNAMPSSDTILSMMKHASDRRDAASGPINDARAGSEPRARAMGRVVAVCISPGGVPKTPVPEAQLTAAGFVGDGHDHEKHIRPHRAVLIQDEEKLEELRREGYALAPGTLGENLTVRDLHVQSLAPGTQLRLENGPLLQLSEPRRPCFVLDQIDPRLQDVVVGRCGYLASVIESGPVRAGQRITVVCQ